jgi:hypothetical protein
MELLRWVWITQAEALEASIFLPEVLLAELLNLSTTDIRRKCLDKKCRLRKRFVAKISTTDWKQIQNTHVFSGSRGFAFLLLNYTSRTVAVILVKTFESKVSENIALQIPLPLLVCSPAEREEASSKSIANLGNVALFEPFFVAVLLNKQPG